MKDEICLTRTQRSRSSSKQNIRISQLQENTQASSLGQQYYYQNSIVENAMEKSSLLRSRMSQQRQNAEVKTPYYEQQQQQSQLWENKAPDPYIFRSPQSPGITDQLIELLHQMQNGRKFFSYQLEALQNIVSDLLYE